jgi:hypothetical protein
MALIDGRLHLAAKTALGIAVAAAPHHSSIVVHGVDADRFFSNNS